MKMAQNCRVYLAHMTATGTPDVPRTPAEAEQAGWAEMSAFMQEDAAVLLSIRDAIVDAAEDAMFKGNTDYCTFDLCALKKLVPTPRIARVALYLAGVVPHNPEGRTRWCNYEIDHKVSGTVAHVDFSDFDWKV